MVYQTFLKYFEGGNMAIDTKYKKAAFVVRP